MFIRVKTTPNSPRRAVQVVESERRAGKVSQRIVRHVGIALDQDEETKLSAMAQEFMDRTAVERANKDVLFTVESVRRSGRPGRPEIGRASCRERV